jgi:RHS repeat-associated protein
VGGLLEERSDGSEARRTYTLNGQAVAVRRLTPTTNTVSYLHGDHLGSVSLATDYLGGVEAGQEFDPWGLVLSGGITATTRNDTGQHLDGTGLLYYTARYYDPAIGRFISADTVVPGNASGGMEGVAVKPLTVGFHETQFLGKLNGENKLGFWFQLSDRERQRAGEPWGPSNPQALNRYAYVLNNPLKYTDPSGHCSAIPAFDVGCFNKAKAILLSPNASFQDKITAMAYINATHALAAAGAALSYLAGVALGPAAIPLGTNLGKLGTVVNDPKLRIQQVNTHGIEKHGVTRAMIEGWQMLPKIVLSQNNGQRFLHITREGAYVIDASGRVVTAYTRSEYTHHIMEIARAAGIIK